MRIVLSQERIDEITPCIIHKENYTCVNNPIFPCIELFICTCDDINNINKYFGHIPANIYDADQWIAYTVDETYEKSTGDEGILLLFKEGAVTPGIIAHEIVHACTCACEKIGIPINTDCDESAAYLTEFITDCVYSSAVKSIEHKS